MKNAIIIGVMAATIFVAGCGKKDVASDSSGSLQVAKTNPDVVILHPVHTSSDSQTEIVTNTSFEEKADLESVTNAVRTATSDPIV